MNNIIKKGIIFILVFVPAIIFAQDKLYNQQKEIVLFKEELQLLLQKIAEAKMRKIRGEKLANLHKSQQKKAVSNIYESNEVKNFYYLAQNADSTHTDIEQVRPASPSVSPRPSRPSAARRILPFAPGKRRVALRDHRPGRTRPSTDLLRPAPAP